jgi:hypothetical protein
MYAFVWAVALLIAGHSFAEEPISWGKSERASPVFREEAEGLNAYFDRAQVKKAGDLISFTLYTSYRPEQAQESGMCVLNCKTHEFVVIDRVGRKRGPTQLLPGEKFYPLASEFCDWKPGLFNRMVDGQF